MIGYVTIGTKDMDRAASLACIIHDALPVGDRSLGRKV